MVQAQIGDGKFFAQKVAYCMIYIYIYIYIDKLLILKRFLALASCITFATLARKNFRISRQKSTEIGNLCVKKKHKTWLAVCVWIEKSDLLPVK